MIKATTKKITTGTGINFSRKTSNRCLPIHKKLAGNTPSATSPEGNRMPVAIDLPSVGTLCNPINKNIIPSVANKSGTFIFTINKPLMRPTKAPINKQAIIATNALCSNITNIYADIISEEVATDPIERSNPSTTSVHVTPNANIPVIATD